MTGTYRPSLVRCAYCEQMVPYKDTEKLAGGEAFKQQRYICNDVVTCDLRVAGSQRRELGRQLLQDGSA